MAAQLKFFVLFQGDVGTVWVQNGSHKYPLFRSDDSDLVAKRKEEIEEDLKKSRNYADTMLALYRFARDSGCVEVMKPRLLGAILSMRPDKGQWVLVLRRGRQEVIVKRDTQEKVKESYFKMLELKKNDPSIYNSTWEYAMQKARVTLQQVK